MKNFLYAVVVGSSLFIAQLKAEEGPTHNLQSASKVALVPGEKGDSKWVFYYSATEKSGVGLVRESNSWIPAELVESAVPNFFVYRVKDIQSFRKNQTFISIRSVDKDSDAFVVQKFSFAKDVDQEFLTVEKEERGTTANTNVPKDFLQPEALMTAHDGDPYGFIAVLNNYRMRNHRQPVVYDEHLSRLAAENNRRGGHHAYMGFNNGCQNWAPAGRNASGAVAIWSGSSGHNANMLDSRVRRVGIAYSPSAGWTMNGAYN